MVSPELILVKVLRLTIDYSALNGTHTSTKARNTQCSQGSRNTAKKEVSCSNFLQIETFSFGGKFIKTQDILRNNETSSSVGKLGKTQEVYNSITPGSSYS